MQVEPKLKPTDKTTQLKEVLVPQPAIPSWFSLHFTSLHFQTLVMARRAQIKIS